MKVFSTLKAAHIDLSRTASEGVAGLRAFLEYAEKGRVALPIPNGALHSKTGGLEEQIAWELQQRGYELATSVGSSGFRIDAAVVHPKQPGAYALAILADGYGFVRIGSARDRFVGKIQVLRNLGWQVYRVWSAEWWINREAVLTQIEEAIQQATQAPDSTKIETLAEAEAASSSANSELILQNALNHETSPLQASNHWPHQMVYPLTNLPPITRFTAAEFTERRHSALIAGQLRKVVETEAPITRRLLYQRVLQAWSIARLGSRIEAYLDALCRSLSVQRWELGEQDLILPSHMDLNAWRGYRVPDAGNSATRRNPEDIPIPEIANGMHEILEHQVSLAGEDLLREAARIFGFVRSGTIVDAAMQKGLFYAANTGMITERNGRWVAVNR